jgi:hypothetical protein
MTSPPASTEHDDSHRGSIGPEEISGGFEGETFDYSTLGVNEFLRLLMEFGCTCKHLEYDQYPENHVYIIAQKSL